MRRLALLAALLTLAGCDETPTAPSRREISGRWIVSSLHPVNAVTIVPPGNVVLAVEFVDDRVAVQSDCNVCSGRFALNDRAITLSPLACTRRACPAGSLEGPFLDVLFNVQMVGIIPAAVLLLEGPRGRIVLHRSG